MSRPKSSTTSSQLNILSDVSPDIFQMSPRPGGFLKVMVPTRSQDYMVATHDSCPCHPGDSHASDKRSLSANVRNASSSRTMAGAPLKAKISREFRLKSAIQETDWEDPQPDDVDIGVGSPVHATLNMLAVTISCVMMMAADEKVPEDYLNWAMAYLQCIRDDDGQPPPNIEGIMNEIVKRLDSNYQPGSGSKKKESDSNLEKGGGKDANKSSSKLDSKKSSSNTGKVKSSKSLDKSDSSSKSKSDKSVTKHPSKNNQHVRIPSENVNTLSAE